MDEQDIIKKFELYCNSYKPIYVETASTNTLALENADKYNDNTVIISPTQSDGHGREHRQFVSREGGAYFSIVNKIDKLDLNETAKYVFAAGLAVYNVLAEYGIEAGLKWPNDVFVDGKKICGILCESITDASGEITVITGIGINIYNDIVDIENSTRLAELVIFPIFIEEIIALTVEYYDKLLMLSEQEILEKYRKRCISIGKEVIIVSTEQSGTAVGVSKEGFLEVETANGIIEVKAGDVSLKKPL